MTVSLADNATVDVDMTVSLADKSTSEEKNEVIAIMKKIICYLVLINGHENI